MIKQYKLNLIIILLFVVQIYPQTIGEQKLLEMKNSFILGLTEKGFEIGAELMSRNEYADVREDATFYIAEFFFTLASLSEEHTNYPSKAYTYYLVLQKDYPSSKYANTIIKRINTLITFFQNSALFGNLFDIGQNEATIVEKKLKFMEKLYTFNFPDPYLVFLKGRDDIPTSEVLSRYCDEIIVNYPEFEIYATYYKIISNLSEYFRFDYVSDGLFKSKNLDSNKPLGRDYVHKLGLSFNDDLNKISINFPHHPLTLELHLIYAKIFMRKDGDIIDKDTKAHLEFVIQNELDKTHPRYLLTREFLLNNQFK